MPSKVNELAHILKESSGAGRTADTSTVKKYLNVIIAYTGVDPKVPVSKDSLPDRLLTKHHQGFQNVVTGRLLCPVGLAWDNEDVQRRIRSGKRKVIASDFPSFCYPSGAFNEAKMEEGLFRGSACIKAAQAIFTGPSSCTPSRDRASTRAGNAERAGIVSMTPRSIAYVLCQLRFGLSSVQNWTWKDGSFNLEQFYWNAIEAIEESPQFKEDLIEFWDDEIFGAGGSDAPDPGDDDGDLESTNHAEKVPSMLSRLKAQRAANLA